MPTVKGEPEWLKKALDEARREGRLTEAGRRLPPGASGPKGPVRFVSPDATHHNGDRSVWTIQLRLDPVTRGGAFKKWLVGVAGKHRKAVAGALAGRLSWVAFYAELAQAGLPVACHIDRIGGGEMDDDNLAITAKWVRDTVALFLGVGDGPRGPVRWSYGQEPGPAYGVRITLSEKPL